VTKSSPKKFSRFFALYDYGKGGLWVMISAESAEQIRDKYPMLRVFDGEPPMLDSTAIEALHRAGVQRIEDAPIGWLADLECR
jgi:hypothetical protein